MICENNIVAFIVTTTLLKIYASILLPYSHCLDEGFLILGAYNKNINSMGAFLYMQCHVHINIHCTAYIANLPFILGSISYGIIPFVQGFIKARSAMTALFPLKFSASLKKLSCSLFRTMSANSLLPFSISINK